MSAADGVKIPVCPFDGGPPEHVRPPGGHTFCCAKCGAIGPTAYDADGPDAYGRALKMWSMRGGVGNVRVAAVPTGLHAEAAIVAENLRKVAEKIDENEYGPISVSLLMLFDPVQRRLGVVRHNLDGPGMLALMQEVANGMRQAEASNVATPDRRIILAR